MCCLMVSTITVTKGEHMGIISWILLGALAGWIVSLIMGTNAQQGAIGNIVVGIVGALIGGFLGSKLLGLDVTGLNITSLLLAIGGGVIFAFIMGSITGHKSV